MTRVLVELNREGQLNSLIRSKRDEDFKVLYYSLWDKESTEIVENLRKEWVHKEGDETLFLVNSWDLPHSFVAFQVSKVPCLVSSVNGRIRKEDQPSRIWTSLNSRLSRKNRAF